MTLLGRVKGFVDHAEAYAIHRKLVHVRCRESALELTAHRKTSVGALRVLVDGKLGSSYGESPDEPELLQDAREAASFGQKADFVFAPSQTYADASCYDHECAELTAGDLIDTCMDLCQRVTQMDADARANIVCEAESGRRRIETTEGATADQQFSHASLFVELPFVSRQADVGATAHVVSIYPLHVSDAWLEGLLEMRAWGAGSSVPASGRLPVLLTPQVSHLLTLTLAECLSSRHVAAGVSPLGEKIDSAILSEMITVEENPLHADLPLRRSFDDEGVAVEPRTIVDRGTLRGFAADLAGGAELGIASTGNAVRRTLFSQRIENAPIPSWLGAIVAPGRTAWRTMMAGIEEGILVTRMLGLHSSNLLQGQFSAQVNGFHIRKGVPVGYLERTMISGNVFEEFAHVRAVSREREPTAQGPMAVAGLAPYILLDAVQVTSG